MITGGLLVLGQFLFYKSLEYGNYWFALLGRFVYGLGGESYTVATSVLEATWFMGKELSFAVSVDYGMGNFAEFSNDTFEPTIYNYKKNSAYVFWVGFLLCILTFIVSLFVFFIDGKRLAMEKETDRPQSGENFDMKDILSFKWDFWIMSLATAFSTLIWVLFNNIASEFFQMKFDFTLQTSGMLIGLEALAAGFLIPPLGLLLDKIGHRIIIGTFQYYNSIYFFTFVNCIYSLYVFCGKYSVRSYCFDNALWNL